MQNLIWIISVIFISSIFGFIFKKLYSEKKINNSSNIIRPNKILFQVGCFGSLAFVVLVTIMWFLPSNNTLFEKIIVSIVLIIIFVVLLGGYLIIFYLNFKVMVYEDYFIFYNFWNKKKKIYYKDIKINYNKKVPHVERKLENGKYKLVFKLGGILDNEDLFINTYKNWKKSH